VSPIWNRLAHERGELLSEEHCPGVLEERRARRYTGTVGPLNRWVDELRAGTGERVPWFDPAAARDGAHVLVLLQDPSAQAAAGSGFVSRHNNDPTARNVHLAAERAGLSYDVSLAWNVVPWWVADPTMRAAGRRRTLASEAIRARPHLAHLFHLLDPAPRVVVVAGRHAARAWAHLVGEAAPPPAVVLHCPHPSPQAFPMRDRATGRTNADLVVEAFRTAATLVRAGTS
jgi:uracil-DNA glycosylase